MMNTLNTENPIEKPFRKTGDPVDLTSESPLHPRRKSRRIMVGPVPVGGGAPIGVETVLMFRRKNCILRTVSNLHGNK